MADVDDVAVPIAPARPPRPPNAWLLYRGDRLAMLSEVDSRRPQGELSKAIAAAWRAEPTSVRAAYDAAARQRKLEHAIRYPNFSYAAKHGRKRRKSASNALPAICPGAPSADAGSLVRAASHDSVAPVWVTDLASTAAGMPAQMRSAFDAAPLFVADDAALPTPLSSDGAIGDLHAALQPPPPSLHGYSDWPSPAPSFYDYDHGHAPPMHSFVGPSDLPFDAAAVWSPTSSAFQPAQAALPSWWPHRHLRIRYDAEHGVELQHFLAALAHLPVPG